MRASTLKAIQEHAVAEYPRECCGLLVRVGAKTVYHPCTNKSADEDHFQMDARDYAEAEDKGEIIAIVHSHPDESDRPSEWDLVAMESSKLPWYILSVSKEGAADTINRVEPVGYKAPLIGRSFHHGTLDCYSLVKDFYAREMGITLPDYERQDNWWSNGQNLYLDNLKDAGFYEIEEGESPQFGDMILMEVRASVPNHAGIFLGDNAELEGQKLFLIQNAFIHHLFGRSSTREVYGGYWAKTTRLIVRHKDARA